MENHYKPITVEVKDWEFFTKAKCLEFDYCNLKFNSDHLKKDTNDGPFDSKITHECGSRLDGYINDIDTRTFNIFCVQHPHMRNRNSYLLRKREPDEDTQSVLLLDGSIDTKDFDCSELVDIFNGQIEADEKAFKEGLIRYPIYELLGTVSKLIKDRNKKYSVIFTGKRNLSYKNSGSADNTIHVNLESGCFMLNDSKREYIAYMPTVSDANLLDFRKEKCYTFADRLNIRLAELLDLRVINETMEDREVAIYIDRDAAITILIGKGENKPKRKVINYFNGELSVEDEIRIPARKGLRSLLK